MEQVPFRQPSVQQNSLLVYRPFPLKCFDSCVEKMQRVFGKECFVTEIIPCPQPVRDGVMWIDAHGVQNQGKPGFLLVVDPNTLAGDAKKLVTVGEGGKCYLPSIHLPKVVNVHKSIVVLDSCYSSEVSIDTLSDWKDNMIFTTGYIADYYNSQTTGMVKALEIVSERLRKERHVMALTYRSVKDNKDYINKILREINAQYKTQYSLF